MNPPPDRGGRAPKVATDFTQRVRPFEERLFDTALVFRRVGRRQDLGERRSRREALRTDVVFAFARWLKGSVELPRKHLASNQVALFRKLVICWIGKKGGEQAIGGFG
jgi:hypothetical protein